jgi:lipopolysaccharide exporter
VGYIKDTARGIGWMGLLRGSTRFMGFVRVAVLARLLAPEQFGIYGIASLMLALLEVLTETGINVFLVQDDGQIKDYLDTAWVVSIARGILISAVMFSLARPISLFFKTPQSFEIILFISIVPFLRGFINPSIIRFQKELTFKKEFIFRSVIFFFDASVAILVAFITKNAVSLVWGLLSGVLLEIVLSFYFVKPTPSFSFEKVKVKRVINRGKWMTFAGIFNYLFQQGDDMVVGRVMDATSLGTYQVAYKISTLPVTEAGEVFNKVTFPVYARIKEDKVRLKDAFLKVTATIAVLVIPFGFVLFFFANPVVRIVLGEKWLMAVPVVRVLAIFGIVRSISGSAYSLFLGVNKQEYATYTTLVSILGLAITIYPLVLKYGIVGAGYSGLIGALVSAPLFVYYSFKILKKDES